jgi:hypothetical protein
MLGQFGFGIVTVSVIFIDTYRMITPMINFRTINIDKKCKHLLNFPAVTHCGKSASPTRKCSFAHELACWARVYMVIGFSSDILTLHNQTYAIRYDAGKPTPSFASPILTPTENSTFPKEKIHFRMIYNPTLANRRASQSLLYRRPRNITNKSMILGTPHDPILAHRHRASRHNVLRWARGW